MKEHVERAICDLWVRRFGVPLADDMPLGILVSALLQEPEDPTDYGLAQQVERLVQIALAVYGEHNAAADDVGRGG